MKGLVTRISPAKGAVLALLLAAAVLITFGGTALLRQTATEPSSEKKDFIKWVDFNVTYEVLERAMEIDIATREDDQSPHLSWIDMLAYLAAKNGNKFDRSSVKQLNQLAEKLKSGTPMEELAKNLKYYDYYHEVFTAVLGGFLGEFEEEVPDENSPTGKRWEAKYGLKAYSPIAKNFPYSDYDDFGAARSYGFKRRHLGHDMMGQTGTPIIAVESGVVEALGWNQYGGWRIGIRSFDRKRYYYYAHLRKNFPYELSLKEGSVVQAGDVIGYMGHSGYSTKENVNNIDVPHLHFGMQLIFDESQKESDNEIWIDVYPIVRLLRQHQSLTVKDPATKNYSRVYGYRDQYTQKHQTLPPQTTTAPSTTTTQPAATTTSTAGTVTGRPVTTTRPTSSSTKRR